MTPPQTSSPANIDEDLAAGFNLMALARTKPGCNRVVSPLGKFVESLPAFRRAICLLSWAAGLSFTAAAQVPLPYSTQFQAPSFSLGSLNGQQNWFVSSGSAAVIDTQSIFGAGSQSVALNPSSTATLAGIHFSVPWPAPAVEYIDCLVKPAAGAIGDPLSRLPYIYLDTSLIVFVGNGTQGGIYTYDGTNFSPTNAGFPVNSDNTSPNWMRLTFRLNFGPKTWDLYGNGVSVAQGLSFIDHSATSVPFFIQQGHPTDPSYLNYVSVGYANPISPLPDMPNVPQPNPLPATPTGWDVFTPPVISSPALPSGSPTIAEWTRTGVSDDSLILTGDQFSTYTGSDQGKDTQFTVYGQTGGSDAIQAPASIQRLDGLKAAITLPSGLPAWSTYFVWPKNSLGYGYPVAVNRTDAWWVGPDQAAPGDTVSVYGRNLSHNGGTTTSWVYIKPVGTAAGQWAAVTSVNPYRVQFTVPSTLANGTYEVWVHNGHGGNYGWSGPLTLTMAAPFAWDSDAGGTFNPNSPATFNVKNYGAIGQGDTNPNEDDTAAICIGANSALGAAQTYRDHGGHPTVYFPPGTYLMSSGIGVSSNIRFMGSGMTGAILRCTPNFNPAHPTSGFGLLFGNGGDLKNIAVQNLTLDSNGNFGLPPATNASMLSGGWTSCDNFHLTNVSIKVDQPGVSCASFTETTHLSLTNCTFIGGEVFLFQGFQQAIANCSFQEANNEEEAVRPWGITDLSIAGCTVEDYNPSPLTGRGQGRFIAANSVYGTQSNFYIGDNQTIALGPPPGDNSGEKILCEGNYTQYSGNPTAATTATVTFGDLSTNGLASQFTAAIDNGTFLNHWIAVVVKGKGLGQYRLIAGYDSAQTITVSPAWNVLPDPASTVLIALAADKWVMYHNDLEGQPGYYATSYTAMTAIEPYGGGYEWIGDSNTIKYMHTALYISELQQDIGYSGSKIATIDPCYFNYYANNTITSCFEGMRAASLSPNVQGQNFGTGFLGNLYRNNTLSDITTVGAYETTNANTPTLAGTLDMTLFEHNTFTNVPEGFDGNFANGVSPIIDAVLYKNTFNLGTAAVSGSFGVNFGTNTLAPALRANTWAGFATTYAGMPPGAILEIPVRNFNLTGTASGGAQTVFMTLWNSGTAPLGWTATSDSSWLTLSSGSGTISDQNSNSTVTLTCNATGLQPGTYTGTVTVSGASQTETITATFAISP